MKGTISKVKSQTSEWEKIIAKKQQRWNLQTINLKNTQAAHAAQFQKNN